MLKVTWLSGGVTNKRFSSILKSRNNVFDIYGIDGIFDLDGIKLIFRSYTKNDALLT